MRKGIVLKILMGVITTGLAVTGITAPAAIDFNQNVTGVSVIAKEDIRVEETIADTSPALEEETNIAEKTDDADGNMTKSESMIHHEQASDAAVVAVVAEGQMSIDVQKAADTANITEPEAAVQPKAVVQPETAEAATQPEIKTETSAAVIQHKAVIQPEAAATTQPETKTETSAVIQPEESIEENYVATSNNSVCVNELHFPPATAATQHEVKTETSAAVTQPEEPIEENHVVTSNTAVCEITIHFPPAVTEAPTEQAPVEEKPVYIEIHDCNCGWNTTDYQALMAHMKNHLFNGEAHSYTTVVIKQ